MDRSNHIFDVAVIGAGMAGLTVAQQLHHAGYTVVVLEKSRGLGGRVATRRLDETCADHGARYLEPLGDLVRPLVQILADRGQIVPWCDRVYEVGSDRHLKVSINWYPYYIAPLGMSAIAKLIADDLKIWLNCRVNAIALTESNTWHLTLETTDNVSGNYPDLIAKSVVVAIPAPQALMLLEPLAQIGLSSQFLDNLKSVEFDPCITAIAGYPQERQRDLALRDIAWRSVSFPDDDRLAWVGWDSSKRTVAKQPIFVFHSKPSFAENYLDATDLPSVGNRLLASAADYLIPWLEHPEWMQVHRWRYAFPRHSWSEICLTADTPLPLVCCGDWCGVNLIESAFESGLAAANQINILLEQRELLPAANFWQVIAKI